MARNFIKKVLMNGLIIIGIGYLDKLVNKIIFYKDRRIAKALIMELPKMGYKILYIHPRLM